MIIKEKGRRITIPGSSPYAAAIRLLIDGYTSAELMNGEAVDVPTRNDVKKLWRELDERHKEVLSKVAPYPNGISQDDLLHSLNDIEAEELRGRNVGLSRICSRLGVDYPIRQTGYARSNRRFYLDPDVAKTVIELTKKKHP